MSQSHQPVSPQPDSTSGVSPELIDLSCRWPLLSLYYGAAFWMVLSALAYLVASMSFHAPAMFAETAWLSYGRMASVASSLLIYGFCIPVGWAAVLWIIARLGRTPLAQGVCAIAGAKLWHLGVLVGTVGILCGGSSGYEGFEFPLYSTWPLLLGAVLIAVSGLTTLRNRVAREMHPVQWFAGLAVLWFPWIYITAVALLLLWPVRGMAQGAVHWWYVAELKCVLLAMIGIGALFYFLPLLKQKPLAGRSIALFALITLISCGGWTGIPLTAPVPAWMSTLSRVMNVWMVIPVLAVFVSLRPKGKERGSFEAKFFEIGFVALMLWTALVLVLNLTGLEKRLAFTLTSEGLNQLFLQGFSVMIGLGAAYHILPYIAGRPLRWPGFIKLHYWVNLIGILLMVAPFLVGGVAQGQKLVDPNVLFTDVAAATLMPIRVATVGQLLLVLGGVLLTVNLAAILVEFAASCVRNFRDKQMISLDRMEGRA